ncbi:hypothetical protein CVT26_001267 [Gymnopilus dilepis]|uniref:SUN domain-containing protein n=1 Tax=Gymnopilus dilepis TaxID=231916 RepID=A0A409WEG5_9AGAR|nr:hypothetical protein CVT26_001267 [Gymnopilus dilepis]
MPATSPVEDRFPLETYALRQRSMLSSGLRPGRGRHYAERRALRARQPPPHHFLSRLRRYCALLLYQALLLLALYGLVGAGYWSSWVSSVISYRLAGLDIYANKFAWRNLTLDTELLKNHLNLHVLRRDYALRANGARILLDFTSATHQPLASADKYDSQLNLRSIEDIYLPSVVLENQLVIGECWQFDGERGHVGIRLAKPVAISDMTINHAHPLLILPTDTGKAPRNFILWALVGISDPSMVYPLPSARHPSTFLTNQGSLTTTAVVESGVFIPLIQGTYDIFAVTQLQRFRNLRADHRLEVEVVILEILNNWGSDTTCLYHAGIHGTLND